MIEWFTNVDWIIVVGELYLGFVLLVVLLFGLVHSKNVTKRLLYMVIFIEILLQRDNCFITEAFVFNYHWYMDHVSSTLALLMGIIVICIISISGEKKGLDFYEIYLFMGFGLLSLILILRSNDFVLFYVILELYSLCMYVLSSIGRLGGFGMEASLKYYVLGALSSGIFLFGYLVCYSITGLTVYSDLYIYFIYDGFEMLRVGLILMSVGFFMKVGLAPFHFWVPDVYEGSSTVVTMYFSLIPKIGLMGVFLRITNEVLFQVDGDMVKYFMGIVILCLGWGSVSGLFQTKIKRLLAYSSIVHGGYLLIPFLCINYFSIVGFFFYLVAYVCMVLSIFLILLSNVGVGEHRLVKLITRIGIMVRSNYYLGVSFTIGFLSLAGIPPFMGFFSKLFLFIMVIANENYFLFFIMCVFSAVSAVYYLRVIRMVFFNKEEWLNVMQVKKGVSYMLSILTHCIVLFCIYNVPITLVSYGEIVGIFI